MRQSDRTGTPAAAFPRRLLLPGTALLCIGMLLTGCDATPDSAPAPAATPLAPSSPATGSSGPHPSGSGPTQDHARPHAHREQRDDARPPGVRKVLVFVVENHSLDQMRTQMPGMFSLAERYGYTTAYRAVTHPSLGNYLAIAGGSTFGIEDDDDPGAHRLHGPSVFSEALAAGSSARVYAEGMPGTCALENGGDRYVVRHNPWTYFVDGRRACTRYDVPTTRLADDIEQGQLPAVGMVVPNLCHDAHDCSLAVADAWLRRAVEQVMAGPDWASGRLAIVVTADEDEHNQGNTVLTIVLHPSLDHVVVAEPLTHLSLSRFLSEVVHQPPLRAAGSAPSLGDVFGLHTPG